MVKVLAAFLVAGARDQIVDTALHLRFFVEIQINLRLCLELLLEKLPIAILRHNVLPFYLSRSAPVQIIVS